MKKSVALFAAFLMSFLAAQPALADEIYAGVAVHAVDTPLSMGTGAISSSFSDRATAGSLTRPKKA